MTVALCTNCGSTKFGTSFPCKECGCGSTGNSDLDIAFTDHYLTEDTLHGFGQIIKCLREQTQDEGVAFWAFMKHITEHYPEIMMSETPRRYDAAAQSLLDQTDVPEVMVEDSPRLDTVEDSTPDAKYMSRVRHHRIECESCGHVHSFAVWSRINGTANPWLHGMIASGRLFTGRCRQCGAEQIVPYDTLYLNIDNDKPFAIWLRMPDTSLQFRYSTPSQEYFDKLDVSFTLRTVKTPLELAEKIHVFLDGYDDILVEFIKTTLCFQREIDLTQPLYYLATKKGLLSGKTMTFGVLGLEGSEEISYPLSSQKSKLDQIMGKIQPVIPDLSSEWNCVDRDFVMQMLQNNGMMTRLDI